MPRSHRKTLKKFGIELEQVMGIITNSPNVMRGNKKGVFKLLKDMIPTLLDLGWFSLHHVMNAIQACVKEMPRAVDFANYVYCYFENSNSSTHRADYKDVQKEEKLPQHDKSNDFLRPVSPNFLYFELVCQGLLEQEKGLKNQKLCNVDSRINLWSLVFFSHKFHPFLKLIPTAVLWP